MVTRNCSQPEEKWTETLGFGIRSRSLKANAALRVGGSNEKSKHVNTYKENDACCKGEPI